MEEQKIELFQKRDMGQTLITAVQLIKSNPKHFFKTAIVMVLPLFLATSTLSFLSTSTYDPYATSYERLMNEFSGPMSILSIVVSYLYSIACVWAGVYYVKLYEERGPGNFEMSDLWGEVFKNGWKLIFSFLAIALLTFVVVAVASFLATVTVVLIPVFYFGMLYFIVFVIMFCIIYLQEDSGFSNSIDRVFKLLKGRWGSAVSLLLVCILMPFSFFLSPLIITSVLDADSFSKSFDLYNTDSVSLTLILQNVMQILSFLYLILLNLSFAVLYHSLSEEKDYVSLKKRVEDLGPLGAYQ